MKCRATGVEVRAATIRARMNTISILFNHVGHLKNSNLKFAKNVDSLMEDTEKRLNRIESLTKNLDANILPSCNKITQECLTQIEARGKVFYCQLNTLMYIIIFKSSFVPK